MPSVKGRAPGPVGGSTVAVAFPWEIYALPKFGALGFTLTPTPRGVLYQEKWSASLLIKFRPLAGVAALRLPESVVGMVAPVAIVYPVAAFFVAEIENVSVGEFRLNVFAPFVAPLSGCAAPPLMLYVSASAGSFRIKLTATPVFETFEA